MQFQIFHKRESKSNGCLFCFSNLTKEISARGGMTIIIENINNWFLDSVEECDFFDKKIGKSFCSNKDNYNKKEGFKIASSRLKPTKLFVDKIVKLDVDVKIITLRDNLYNAYIFRVDKRKETARFISYKHHKKDVRK